MSLPRCFFPPSDHRHLRTAAFHFLLLAAITALLFASGIGARDLWAPDEPRMAEVAREMLRSGDWLVPRDNGRVYPDKPPLLFWMIALASLPAGEVTAVSARLPVVACGIGTVLLTAALGALWFGPFRGFAAGLILATSCRGFVSSQWIETDSPLAFFTALAVFGAARALARERASAADLAMVHGGIAGALLAKGPVGLAVPALVALGWSVSERPSGLLRRLRPWLLLAAAAPAMAWGLAAQRASDGAYSLAEALQRHVLLRAAVGMHHFHSPLYYLYTFPLEFLPWTLFLAAWAALPAPADPATRAGRRRALLWLVLPLALFTLSAEKRGVYLLPVYPAAALLTAAAWPGSGWPGPGEAGRRRALAPFALLAALAAASFTLPVLAQRWLGAGRTGLAVASVAALAGALLALRAARRGRSALALLSAAGAAAALLLGGSLALAPALNPAKSARPFCAAVTRRIQPADRLALYGPYRSAYVFYTGRFMEELHTPADLERFLAPGGAYCVLERDDLGALTGEVRGRYPPLEEASIGHRRMVLIGAPMAGATRATPQAR